MFISRQIGRDDDGGGDADGERFRDQNKEDWEKHFMLLCTQANNQLMQFGEFFSKISAKKMITMVMVIVMTTGEEIID